jgi:hypothetical protein
MNENENSAPSPTPEEARQIGSTPETSEGFEAAEPHGGRGTPEAVETGEKAPARDKGRRRPRGRRDVRRLLGDSGLPQRLQSIVYVVIQRSRLWKSEKADVAHELIGHFADGLSSGEAPETLEASFGPPPRAAALIRRAKRRQRPFIWRAWARALQVTGVLLALIVAVYVAATIRLFVGSPNISHDYLADLNAAAAAVAPAERAWPLYREALLALEDPAETLREEVRPGQAGWAEIRDYLGRQADVLAIVRDAASRPGLGYVVGYSIAEEDRVLWPQIEGEGTPMGLAAVLLPYLAELRTLGRLLALDAHRAAEAGDGALVTADLEAILGIAGHTGETPILINDLVSLSLIRKAVSTLGQVLSVQPEVMADGQLHDLAHRLAAVRRGRLEVRLESERLWFLDLMQRLYTDDGAGGGRLTAQGLQSLVYVGDPASSQVGPLAPVAALVVAGRREMTGEFNRLFSLAEAEMAKPLWRQDIGQVDREVERLKRSLVYTYRYWPVVTLMPALAKAGRQPELARQECDAVCVVIGLELYRRRTGYWPASLDALVPDLLPVVPPDRFDGKPLRYRLVEGRPLVYSIGSDRDDDQGRTPPAPAGRSMVPRASQVDLDGAPRADGDWVLWRAAPGSRRDAQPSHRAEWGRVDEEGTKGLRD